MSYGYKPTAEPGYNIYYDESKGYWVKEKSRCSSCRKPSHYLVKCKNSGICIGTLCDHCALKTDLSGQ